MIGIKKIKRLKYGISNIKIMKKAVVIGVFLLFICSNIVVAQEDKIINCSFTSFKTEVVLGENFTVILWMNNNFEATGFTLRQMVWESELAELVNRSFEPAWLDDTFNDIGDLEPGNLTYAMANNFAGVNGSFGVMNFTFHAKAEGTLHITIPEIYEPIGQPGMEFSNGEGAHETIWSNYEIVINDPTNDGDDDDDNGGSGGGGGGGGGYVPPPVNKKPVAIIDCPVNGTVNESIFFDGSDSYDEDGSIVKYTWDFPTGDIVGNPIYHTFTTLGNHTVNLIVEDDDGAEDSEMCTVYIKGIDIPDTNDTDEPDEPDDTNDTDVPDQNQTDNNQSDIPEEEEINLMPIYIAFGIILFLVLFVFWKRWFE